MADGKSGVEADWRERFGSHPRDPALFLSARVRPLISLNGRLPRMTYRVVCLLVREINHSNRMRDKTSRWVIPGSRLFDPMFWPFSRSKEYARSFGHVPKRLPSNPAAILSRGFAAKIRATPIGVPIFAGTPIYYRSTPSAPTNHQSLITSSQSPLALRPNARPATGTGCN